MKAALMNPLRHLDPGWDRPSGPGLSADLELGKMLQTAALGYECLTVVRQCHPGLTSPPAITYRQRVLTGCIAGSVTCVTCTSWRWR